MSIANRFRSTYATVDLTILEKNYLHLRSDVPSDAFFCPMIKAGAYGHGDIETAKVLRRAGCEHLGVALIEEGLRLRVAGDLGSVVIFGPFNESGAKVMLNKALTPVLNEWSQTAALEKALKLHNGGTVDIHLEFNTGMNRLGFSKTEAGPLRAWLDSHKEFRLRGICSHLSRGEDIADPGGESALQLAVFAQCLIPFQGLQFQVHLLNSGACAKVPVRASHPAGSIGARPGIAIYGAQVPPEKSLKPVLSLSTQLCNVHRIQPGEGVSYGPKWRATRASVIGVVPVGYADGYSRALSGCGIVLFRGQRAKIVGTICMDYFMIDLTDIFDLNSRAVEIGEEIVLIGRQGQEEVTAAELASLGNTIAYEILSCLSSRVPRVYV